MNDPILATGDSAHDIRRRKTHEHRGGDVGHRTGRAARLRAALYEGEHRFASRVVDGQLVTVVAEMPRHTRAHGAETDEANRAV